MGEVMTAEQAALARTGVPEWHLDGSSLVRDLTFEDFAEAMDFVNRVAFLAEEARHHPDIEIRWNRVRLRLVTHSAGGLTGRDFSLAARLDQVVCPG